MTAHFWEESSSEAPHQGSGGHQLIEHVEMAPFEFHETVQMSSVTLSTNASSFAAPTAQPPGKSKIYVGPKVAPASSLFIPETAYSDPQLHAGYGYGGTQFGHQNGGEQYMPSQSEHNDHQNSYTPSQHEYNTELCAPELDYQSGLYLPQDAGMFVPAQHGYGCHNAGLYMAPQNDYQHQQNEGYYVAPQDPSTYQNHSGLYSNHAQDDFHWNNSVQYQEQQYPTQSAPETVISQSYEEDFDPGYHAMPGLADGVELAFKAFQNKLAKSLDNAPSKSSVHHTSHAAPQAY